MAEIIAQKNGRLNDEDRLELAKLLIKAGYITWVGRRKMDGNGKYATYIGFMEPDKPEEIGRDQ